MHPQVDKGTYARTHDHVIYSNRLSNSEQQHHAAASHQLIHADEQQFIFFKSATYFPLNYIPQRVLLGKKEIGNTKSIRELLHNVDDLVMNSS